MRKSSFRLYWTGVAANNQFVTVYRKRVQIPKKDETYTLRALTHNIATDGCWVITNAEDYTDLPDDLACDRQVKRWQKRYRWQEVNPQFLMAFLEAEKIK